MSDDLLKDNPLARIRLTRERLREAMLPPLPQPRGSAKSKFMSANKWKDLPVIGTVIEAAQAWWIHHPMRPMASVAVEASNAVVHPLAEKNPIALVAGAAITGALVVWMKPWRWIAGTLMAGLAPQVATRIVSNLPIESWMTMLGAMLAQPRPKPASGASMNTRPAAQAPLQTPGGTATASP